MKKIKEFFARLFGSSVSSRIEAGPNVVFIEHNNYNSDRHQTRGQLLGFTTTFERFEGEVRLNVPAVILRCALRTGDPERTVILPMKTAMTTGWVEFESREEGR